MITEIDLIARALSRLPSMYRSTGDVETNTEKALRALLAPAPALQTAALAVLASLDVDTAVGFMLERIGKRVGRPRNGVLDDEVYRRYIRAQISANKSDGLIEDILTVARLVVFDEDAALRLVNLGGASYILYVEGIALPTDVAATLSTSDLSGTVVTDGTPWDAALTWRTPGTDGNGMILDLHFDTGLAAVEVRDNERRESGGWVAAVGTVGVWVTGDIGLDVLISDLEAAINAGSALVQVTTADPDGTQIIDVGALDSGSVSGTFTGGADGTDVATPLVELVLKATAAGVGALIAWAGEPIEDALYWDGPGTWDDSAWWNSTTTEL